MQSARINQALIPLTEAVDDICRYFFQTGKISDQASLGRELEHECLGDLVRGDLCTGVALLLQDGRAASWPFAHIWELCDGSRLKQVRINTFGEYSLAEAVKAISSSSLKSSKDMSFRALIVLGLNMGLLHTWLSVLASRRHVNEKVYDPGALMRSSPAMDAVFYQLCRLLTFPFQLFVESESMDDLPAPPEDQGASLPGGFLSADAQGGSASFRVYRDTGVFQNVEEKLVIGGTEGPSTWSLVFVCGEDQRVLDVGRVIDVTAGDVSAEQPSFTITFGPRTRTETFFCDDMVACTQALHRLLWNFSLMRTPHLIQHREALEKRTRESMSFFVHMARAWYTTATANKTPQSPPPPLPAPLQFDIPDRVRVHDDTGDVTSITDEASVLLRKEYLAQIFRTLPRRLQSRRLRLVYTTDEHGFSLTNFLNRTKEVGQTVLVIRDSKENVFGVFASEGWHIAHGYYGTGEAFVFKLSPELKIFQWVPNSNNFILQAEETGLGVGGGAGGSALWIDNNFKHGRTNSCPTFESEPLSTEENFLCLKLECWGFIKPKAARVSSY